LRNNDLKRVDPEFARGRKNLLRFYLDGNPLKEIPQAILKTGAVAILDFLRKKIDEEENLPNLPGQAKAPAVSIVSHTPDVVVNDPKIVELPYLSSNIETLTCKSTPIRYLPERLSDGSLSSLTKVEISKALIDELPELNLPRLQIFKLSGTKVILLDLKVFKKCAELTEVRMPLNKITQLNVAGVSLPRLSVLDLEDNALETVSEAVMMSCPALQQLMLMNNNIRAVPLAFGSWKSLRNLSLTGNPIKAIPQSVILKGTEAVKRLLKERSQAD
jgi:Leucine-rich repeat (LRR) protein